MAVVHARQVLAVQDDQHIGDVLNHVSAPLEVVKCLLSRHVTHVHLFFSEINSRNELVK